MKAGMLAARGEALLMMDADGATQVRDLERLEAALAGAAKNGVCPGSRCALMSSVTSVAANSVASIAWLQMCADGASGSGASIAHGFALFSVAEEAVARAQVRAHALLWHASHAGQDEKSPFC